MINVRVRDGMCPDPTTGEGGATEGDIRGSFSDIIDVVGVKDLAGGHCAVTENSPAALSVLVAPGVVYVPNADYDELDSNEPKFYEAIIDAEGEVTITANTSGSTRIDLICVKVDKTITPDEHASNIATLVAVAGTPGAGAPTLPDNYAKLAEVEVANGAATIVNADITSTRVQSKIDFDFLPKATGAEINTGTEDAKIVTPKAIADSKLADYIRGDGWISANETWEYVSVDDPTGIFRVNADVTGKYSAGMRIKMTNGGNVIYGIITVVGAYTGGYTSITFLHQIDPADNLALYLMANSAITANYYSTQKAPFGFPTSPLKWSVEVLDSTERYTDISATTWTEINSALRITLPIGLWYIEGKGTPLSYYAGGKSEHTFRVTLSSATNSESSTRHTNAWSLLNSSATFTDFQMSYKMQSILEVTSKTIYYLLAYSKYAIRIFMENQISLYTIRATCAYL